MNPGVDEQADPGASLLDHPELLVRGHRALDLGCGIGADTAALLAAGLEVVGLDSSERLLGIARQQVPGALFVPGDLTALLPFADSSFALCVASCSLHYFDLPTTRRAVAEVRRALRPGGALLCRVNAVGDESYGYGEGEEIEPGFFELRPGVTKRFFDEDGLRGVLAPAFEVRSVEARTTNRFGADKRVLVAVARRV